MTTPAKQEEWMRQGRYAELLQLALAETDDLETALLAADMAFADAEFAQGDWQPHRSRTGKPAWKNRMTGEIRYQRERPGGAREADYRTQPPPQRRQPQSAPQQDDWRTQPPPRQADYRTQPPPLKQAATPPAPVTVHQQRLGEWMRKELSLSALSPEKQAEYAQAAERVFSQYTPQAASRFAAGIKQRSRFFSDNQALNDQFVQEYGTHPIAQAVREGKGSIGGMYKRSNGGSLFLDGDWSRKRDPTGSKTHEVYAHEFMHAIDGPKNEISKSDAWQSAWKNEIVNKGVSEYAWTEPAEGLAEFARLLYSGSAKPEVLKKNYPQCMRVLHDWGLHAYGA